MADLPLNINMQGRAALVVGGGSVALRKATALLDSGARVRVVAPAACAELAEQAHNGSMELNLRPFEPADLDGVLVAIAATDDRAVNALVAREGERRGILVNVADAPTEGSFSFPAVLRRGDLVIAVSTGGGSPVLASLVRDLIAGQIGVEYAAIAERLTAEREKLLTEGNPSTYNMQVLRSLAEELLAELPGRKETLP